MRPLFQYLQSKSDVQLASQDLLSALLYHATPLEVAKYLYEITETYEQFQQNLVAAYKHQLGFFKFILFESSAPYCRRVRIHFWEPCSGSYPDDIHDHAYSFASRVMFGNLKNVIYEVGNGGEKFNVESYHSSGQECNSCQDDLTSVSLLKTSSEEIRQPKCYFLTSDTLHQSIPYSNGCITIQLQDVLLSKKITVARRGENILSRKALSAIPLETEIAKSKLRLIAELIGRVSINEDV